LDAIADEAERAFFALRKDKRSDEDEVEDQIRAKVKRWLRQNTGKRALVEVIAMKV